MKKNAIGLTALVIALLAAPLAHSATEWSAQEYDLYPGDFDGDDKTDILYIAKDSAKLSGIAVSDGTAPNVSWQSWSSNYLGIQWYGEQYTAIVGDFNNDNKADVLMQRSSPGDSYLLLADSAGRLTGITQTIASSHLGLGWSKDQHVILAGDFNGDGRDDLFFQATSPAGTHAVVLATTSGTFTSGPTQTFTDASWSAFKWSTKNSVINVGDFNGDGRADLLIQAKPNIVMIDYEIPIPVPVYAPNSFGVVYSHGGVTPLQQAGVQQWSRNHNGVDWSPNNSTPIIGDFNGDGRDDVLLQPKVAGQPAYLMYGNASGAAFSSPTTTSPNVPIHSDSARLIAGHFSGNGPAGLYIQSLLPTGSNYSVSGVSTSITAVAQSAASITATLNPVTAAGATTGAFAVDKFGAATYRISIQVPPGINGIQPSLSLNYSSHAGNGLLGIGWSLGGFSQITLCQATLGEDGYESSRLLDDQGVRLCLDGQKLRQTNASDFVGTGPNFSGEFPYHRIGATYDTLTSSFLRAVNHGTKSTPASHISVFHKAGLEYEYGITPDSRIQPAGESVTYAWLLSRVKDRSGNVMSYEYERDGSNGGIRPKRIIYTANSSAAIAPAYKVEFVWESRPQNERIVERVMGSLLHQAKRLRAIETFYNGILVRRYELTYLQSVAFDSRLVAIQECAGVDTCFAPTAFAWQNATAQWGAEQAISVNSPPYTPIFNAAAFAKSRSVNPNGEELSYLIFPEPPTQSPGPYYGSSSTRWGKLSIFGWAQVPSALTTTYYHQVNHATGQDPTYGVGEFTGYDPAGNRIERIPTTPIDWVGDVDGDGLAEVIRYQNGQFRYSFAHPRDGYPSQVDEPINIGGLVQPHHLTGGTITSDSGFRDSHVQEMNAEFSTLPDFNGDGKSDFLVKRDVIASFSGGTQQVTWRLSAVLISGITGYQMVVLSAKNYCTQGGVLPACNESGATAAPVELDVIAADFNGDEFTDVLNKDLHTNSWQILLGSAAGLSAPINLALPATLPNVVARDFTGDARSDLLYSEIVGGTSVWRLLRWNGSGFSSAVNNIVPDGAQHVRLMDVNGDKQKDILYFRDGSLRIRMHTGPAPDHLYSITDGADNAVVVSYTSPMDPSVHGAGSNYNMTSSGDVYSPPSNTVVKSHRVTEGSGDAYTISQRYIGPRTNVKFLGYEQREQIDSRTGLVQHTDYLRRSPPDTFPIGMAHEFAGFPVRTWVTQSDGTLVKETIFRYTRVKKGYVDFDPDNPGAWYEPTAENGGWSGRDFVYAHEVTDRFYEVGGSRNGVLLTETKRTIHVMDEFGNATDVTTVVQDKDTLLPASQRTFTTHLVSTITNDTTHWCLGRSHLTQTTLSLGDGSSRTEYRANVVDYEKCRATDAISHADAAGQPTSLSVTTHADFAPQACGNPSAVTITGRRADGTLLAGRVTQFEYATCVAPTRVTDPLGNWTDRTYDYRFGMVKTETDPNNLSVIIDYDNFGRLVKVTRPNNTSTTIELSSCNLTNNYCGVSDLRIRAEAIDRDTTGAAIATSTAYFDSIGRVRIQAMPSPLTNALSYVVSTYDAQGRLATRTVPYVSGSPARNVYHYDLAGRQVSVQLYDGGGTISSETSVRHEGRLLIYKDTQENETAKIFDVVGQLRTVSDPVSSLLTRYDYTYSGSDLVNTVTDQLGNQLVTNLNAAGYKIRAQDPDMGTWTYEYNSLGELTKQTDAKGQVVTFDDYDLLGRPTVRHEVEGDTNFEYGTPDQHAFGQLRSISKGGYTETYSFDSLGRPSATQIDIPNDSTYSVGYSYDSNTGMLDTLTYPASVGLHPLKLKYGYTGGVQTSVRDFTNDTLGTTYWQLTSLNSAWQITGEQLGNGMRVLTDFDLVTGMMSSRKAGTNSSATNIRNISYQWHSGGNLKRRTDHNQDGLYEHFYYDALNRMDYSTRNGVTNLEMTYNEIGNITSKFSNDVSNVGSYNYTNTQVGCSYYSHSQPHAVRSAGVTSYCYDANGNMTKRGTTDLQWYSDNMVKKITQGGVSSEFWYSPTGDRFKQHALYANGSETTYYIGGLMEKVVVATGTAYRHYIASGSNVTIHTRWDTGSSQTRYLTTDHLGSYSAITDHVGALVVEQNFDAFGKRRGSNWSGTPSPAAMQQIANTSRGYTGHEHLDNLGLIHMNGRVQDPLLGRFLSADPFIQEPESSQSLNRYSYVWNNPLSMTDPSGFEAEVCRSTGLPSEMPCVPVTAPRDDPPRLPDGLDFISSPYSIGGQDYIATISVMSLPTSENGGTPSRGGGKASNGILWGHVFSGDSAEMGINSMAGVPPGVPDWMSTSGVCLGGCHGTTPSGPSGPMSGTQSAILYGLAGVATLPVGGEMLVLARAGYGFTNANRIRSVAQKGFDYAVMNPRYTGLNRMLLGKDAEVQATRWLRKWAEKNHIKGIEYQVRGANSQPDIVFRPRHHIFDFKLTPRAVKPKQGYNFRADFPEYDVEYIFGPGPWRY